MRDWAALRACLAPWGALKSQPASDWQGPGPLPPALADFYREVGPWGETFHASVGAVGLTIAAGGNPVEVPPLHKLWARQAGFAWSRSPAEPLPGWPAQWLVIALEGSNPFVLDRDSGAVLFHFSGCGHWREPRVFAPDLAMALGGIATVANALGALGDEALDDDYTLKDSSRDFAARALAEFTGDSGQAQAMLAAWQWYL
ncbi:hypothetical protein [Tahibacter harae]|uniref:SMI1/KNR4 family protein n=1 Tax=Tahibacter harae TaxID=2963937 RepID=A0ABT1QUX2_9GAMM|nr:hypothetical protein [Tahibacter harae]MCQ4166088.1 hypothetical protein [Tahibacter harae]